MSDAHALADRLERMAQELRYQAQLEGRSLAEDMNMQVPIRSRCSSEVIKSCAEDVFRAALDALACEAAARQLRAGPAEGWQPIATAPRDRNILAYLGTERTAVVCWAPALCRGHWNWYETGVGGCVPTHWQPLPAPPPAPPEPA